MKKALAIIIGIALLTFVGAMVIAKTGLNVATPKAEAQGRELTPDSAGAKPQTAPGSVFLSHRNKAKIELGQQRILRQQQIDKERTVELAQQQ